MNVRARLVLAVAICSLFFFGQPAGGVESVLTADHALHEVYSMLQDWDCWELDRAESYNSLQIPLSKIPWILRRKLPKEGVVEGVGDAYVDGQFLYITFVSTEVRRDGERRGELTRLFGQKDFALGSLEFAGRKGIIFARRHDGELIVGTKPVWRWLIDKEREEVSLIILELNCGRKCKEKIEFPRPPMYSPLPPVGEGNPGK